MDLIIKNARVYTEYGLLNGGVAVAGERIVMLGEDGALPEAGRVVDAGGKVLLPGGVDPHVHFRDPGHSERETFFSGSMAAAAGGVTTVCEHPISNPPPYSPEILHRRAEIAAPQSVVDYAFFGAAGADRLEQIPEVAQEGILAFKTFFHAPPEGREQEFVGLTMANDAKILAGFEAVAKTGKILAIHAENNDMISEYIRQFRAAGKVQPIDHALSRPPITEVEAVAKVLCLAKMCGTRVELCHISTPQAAELVKQAKKDGVEAYLETCPHYLWLSVADLEKHGPYAKCNPPLRDRELAEKLWEYVADGSVDLIGSDHGPFLPAEKDTGLVDIFRAPAGFPGIDLRLPLMLTAVKQGRLTLGRMVELISTNPARIYKLYPRKGVIRVEADADLVLVDPDAEFTVDHTKMYSQSRGSAKVYEGRTLTGLPVLTVSRGRIVMENGVVDQAAAGWGRWIKPLA